MVCGEKLMKTTGSARTINTPLCCEECDGYNCDTCNADTGNCGKADLCEAKKQGLCPKTRKELDHG